MGLEAVLQGIRERFKTLGLERVQRLERALDALERQGGDSSALDEALHEIHAIKGDSMMVEMVEVNALTRRVERLLIFVRDQRPGELPAFTALARRGLAGIRDLLAESSTASEVELASFELAVDELLRSAARSGESTPLG